MMKLKSLVVPAVVRDWLNRAHETVALTEADELAEWWCDLNARGWPVDAITPLENYKPLCASLLMEAIQRKVGEPLVFAAWQMREDCK